MSGITIPTLDEITGHTVMAKLRSLCKKFIGLAQEVDDKIDAPLEEAHLAVETANATLATAQDALEDAQDAVTTANSASETANSASETANLASESAQESATTVAGYNTRLTAVENGKINITDINNYAVGLTGNQGPIAGAKLFSSLITIERTGIQPGLFMKRTDVHVGSETVNKGITYISWVDADNVPLASLNVVMLPAGNARMTVVCRNTDGTLKELTLLTGDVI